MEMNIIKLKEAVYTLRTQPEGATPWGTGSLPFDVLQTQRLEFLHRERSGDILG